MFKIKFSIIILVFSLLSCNTTEPPPPDNRKLTLAFEDASCTEAWIRLTTENLQLPAEINLTTTNEGGNPKSQILNLKSKDSLLYVDSLLPNKTYKLKASNIQNPVSSNELSVTTMDTTSHNFTWQTFTFGEHSSSVLYDVAIIDENNIWAVGEIYMNDSFYNAIRWNGSISELKRISVLYNGNLITPPLFGIHTFGENDIWFSSGIPIHGDGEKWVQYHLFDMGILNQDDGHITKLWGSSSSDMYFIGNLGTIVYFNGQGWRKINTNTEFNINGIWGDYDEKNNKWEVLAVGGNILQSTERIILKINNENQVQEISSEGTIEYPISGVWFKSGLKYYISGDGMYSNTNLNKPWQNLSLPNYYGFSIRGQELNDIIVCGGAGYVGYFNGYTWKNYLDGELQEITGNYYSTAIKGNTIAVVGNSAEGKAILVVGKR